MGFQSGEKLESAMVADAAVQQHTSLHWLERETASFGEHLRMTLFLNYRPLPLISTVLKPLPWLAKIFISIPGNFHHICILLSWGKRLMLTHSTTTPSLIAVKIFLLISVFQGSSHLQRSTLNRLKHQLRMTNIKDKICLETHGKCNISPLFTLQGIKRGIKPARIPNQIEQSKSRTRAGTQRQVWTEWTVSNNDYESHTKKGICFLLQSQ